MKGSAAFQNGYGLMKVAAEMYAKKPAFSFLEKKKLQVKTFAQVDQDIRCVAGWFQKNGWVGKKIALVGATEYEWVVCFLAVLYSGSVVIPLNYTESVAELQTDLEHLEPELLLYGKLDPEQTDWARHVVKSAESIHAVGIGEETSPQLDFSAVSPQAPACILFTTGSTGKKKGVVLSQENMVSICEGAAFAIDAKKHKKEISPLPNFHLMKIATIVSLYGMGMEHYINRNSKRTLKDIEEQKPSAIQIVPLTMEAIRKKLEEDPSKGTVREKLRQFDENLKTISVGGAFSNPETIAFFEDLGIDVLTAYGMTEAGVISSQREGRKKQGSVGEIVPGVELRIVDGEILVRGRNVMLGYYKDPEGTKAVLGDGWVHTGDLGYVDEEGFLFLTGRKKNLIILANGENVSPEELEEKLSECPDIQEALVKEKDGHLHAEIYAGESELPMKQRREEINRFIQTMNRENVMYKRIVSWGLRDTPFEKLNSMKIKRN